MAWRKLGLLFGADGRADWMKSHAANPTALQLGDDEFRVFFSSRDGQSRSHIGYADVSIGESPRVVRVADEPVVVPGMLGTFDDSGASMGCVVPVGDATYLYYLGWNLGVTVPWRNAIGLAISPHFGAPFEKYTLAPVLDRSAVDPFTVSYPFIVHEGDLWRMWYGSNLSWGTEHRDMHHVIKYAESKDGIAWNRNGHVAIGLDPPAEYAAARPSVLRERDGTYSMWYCHRGDSYRIGLARSPDGLSWTRIRRVDMDVSADGWDSEMTAYPHVFKHRNRRYMLYCGNGYGRTGFGLAIWEGEFRP